MRWILALHIVFMVTWFAGLFYLPRLFVYHAQARDEVGHARFVIMERRLFAIMSLGAVATVSLGLWLFLGWWWPAPLWLQTKLGLVALLILYHFGCYKLMLDFRAGRKPRGVRFYRFYNEIPALLLLAIVLLAVLKPF
ncbi:MAG TPA: CopD family protein [Gammaproteobacteria bacterium]|nr:CopD family protein [Gammaproteobacteria bacterium]